jgi:hypothetical protein
MVRVRPTSLERMSSMPVKIHGLCPVCPPDEAMYMIFGQCPRCGYDANIEAKKERIHRQVTSCWKSKERRRYVRGQE